MSKICESSPKGTRKTTEERICETDWVWSLEWKAEGVIDGESEDGEAKMGTVVRWYVQDAVNQEESEQNEVDGTKSKLIPQEFVEFNVLVILSQCRDLRMGVIPENLVALTTTVRAQQSKAIYLRRRKIVVQRIAVVKFRVD